jgi:XTP/dITP diphosphohydrolase
MRMIAATKNKGKIREIAKIFGDLGIDVVSAQEAGINIDVEETGSSFTENSLIKARSIAMFCDDIVIADDSGLCVDALGGKPGIHSARYAGENASDKDRLEKLLLEMKNKDDRAAKFVTSVAVVFPDGREFTALGEVKGHILREPIGNNGFGYDPIFYCDEINKSFASAQEDEKNSVSHRSRALKAMYEKIKDYLNVKGVTE